MVNGVLFNVSTSADAMVNSAVPPMQKTPSSPRDQTTLSAWLMNSSPL
jgi:hypothetical protein